MKTPSFKSSVHANYTKRFWCFSDYMLGSLFFSSCLYALWNAYNGNDGPWHMLSIVLNNWITHANSQRKIYLSVERVFKWLLGSAFCPIFAWLTKLIFIRELGKIDLNIGMQMMCTIKAKIAAKLAAVRMRSELIWWEFGKWIANWLSQWLSI